MKEEYYKDIFGGTKYGDYMVYGLDKSESKYSNYEDLIDQLGVYYNSTNFTEESEEQKAIRLAKEKAEKRNNTIDKLLND
jgi:hypothetical protein